MKMQLTDEEISYTAKLDQVTELWITKDFARNSVITHAFGIYFDDFLNSVNDNNSGRETIFEFFSSMHRYGFCDNDVWMKTV